MYNVVKLTNSDNSIEYIGTSKSEKYFKKEFKPTIVAKKIPNLITAIEIANMYNIYR
jgi:hypothetical protein